MDTTTLKQQALKFNRARSNLLLVIVFTVVNLLLTAFNSDIYLLFSASAPLFIFEIGRGLAVKLQNNAFFMIGLTVAFVIIIFYFICWLLAKRLRSFILVALIFFSIDSLFFVFLSVFAGFEVSYLLDIAFHRWILFYLINGVIAWAKLRGVDDLNVDLQEITTTSMNPSYDMTNQISGLQQDDNSIGDLNSRSVPLRVDDKQGRILIAADYEGLQISMKRTRGLTELIVNGNVYDEFVGTLELDYSLTAYVQNKKIIGVNNPRQSHVYLYVNDILIAKKLRLF